MFSWQQLKNLRFGHWFVQLPWTQISVVGDDAVTFLHGQTTNDIKSLEIGDSHLDSCLDISGKVQAFFYVRKDENGFTLFTPSSQCESLVERLEKYIIMEEVELSASADNVLYFEFGSTASSNLNFIGEEVIVSASKPECGEFSQKLFDAYRFLKGFPSEGEPLSEQLVNNTLINGLGVNLNKGCFLGQEVVAKIDSNRGAAKYPCLVVADKSNENAIEEFRIEDQYFSKLMLKREQRIKGREFDFGKVDFFPYWSESTREQKAEELLAEASQIFAFENQINEAIKLLEKAVALAPAYEDAYESLGVLLGRQEKYTEGIELMNKLQELNPKSVMPHTNKSLFLMKLGKIEEAEKEKSEATFKSFAVHGEDAKRQKAEADARASQEAEMIQREQMFRQVLEIDPDDTIANNGLGEIYLERGDFDQSIIYYERVIATDEQYSVAYLGLGKALKKSGQNERAKEVLERGIAIASKRGDLMPANAMQALLIS